MKHHDVKLPSFIQEQDASKEGSQEMDDFDLDRTETIENILLDQTDFFRMRKVSHDVNSPILPPNLAKRYSKIPPLNDNYNGSDDADTAEQQNAKDIFLSPEMPTKIIKNKLNQHQQHQRYHRNGQA